LQEEKKMVAAPAVQENLGSKTEAEVTGNIKKEDDTKVEEAGSEAASLPEVAP
jgi:hypothetical protein